MLIGVPALAAGASVYPELSSIKVRPNAAVKAAGTAKISAARNEFEAFQVVVNGGSSGLSGVSASASDLTGPDGAKIPSSSIWLYREDLLNVTTKSGSIGATGYWPDPLVPSIDPIDGQARNAFPFSVSANQSRAIWVDVLVPKGTVPGLYRGEVQVSGSGFSAEVPVELTVWDFELPSTSSIASAFLAWMPNICIAHYGQQDCGGMATYAEMATKYERMALDHRITLPNVWTGRDHTSDWATFDRYFAPLLDGTAQTRLPGAKMTTGQLTGTRSVTAFSSWADHFRSKGWLNVLYDYTADEPPYGSNFSDIPGRAATVHDADPELRVMVTTNIDGASGYNVLQYLDIIAPVVNHIDTADGGEQRQKYDSFESSGGEVWMYQSCMSQGCSTGGSPTPGIWWPAYMADVSAMRNRLMQWADFRYRIRGELYYETALAFSKDPWNSIFEFSGNGDGTLFYPGTPSKIGGSSQVPVESIRLKMIREGMEDFEYLTLLAKSGDQDLADRLARTVIPSAYTGTDDPEVLADAREQAALRIIELTGAAAPGTSGGSTSGGSTSGGSTSGGSTSGGSTGNVDSEVDCSQAVDPAACQAAQAASGCGCIGGGGGGAKAMAPAALLLGGLLVGLRRRRKH